MSPGCALPQLCLKHKDANVISLTTHGLLGNLHACDVISVVGGQFGCQATECCLGTGHNER